MKIKINFNFKKINLKILSKKTYQIILQINNKFKTSLLTILKVHFF